MFAGVPDIDDLNSASEMLIGDIPDPLGAVAQRHFLFGSIPTSLEGFGVEPTAEPFGSFDRPGIGGGSWISNRAPLRVGCSLCEDTTQFDFASACGLPRSSASAPFQLGVHHRQLCAVHFDVQNRDRSSQNIGKLQLHDAISLGLFPPYDIGPNSLGVALDSLGGEL